VAPSRIDKSPRHSSILGNFGEQLVCYWLSRTGFTVAILDHTGIDVLAHRDDIGRLGISVKSRTRTPTKETDAVNLFNQGDRDKIEKACEAFACEPWVAVFVEAELMGDLFMTSLTNYSKYASKSKTQTWRMGKKEFERYTADANVMHVHFDLCLANWWRPSEPKGRRENS